MMVVLLDSVVISGQGICFPGTIVEVSQRDAQRLIAEGSAKPWDPEQVYKNRAISKEELIKRVCDGQ